MRILDAHAHITSSWEELGIVRDVADSIRLMDRYEIEISFSSDSRALRGGSWNNKDNNARASNRNNNQPNNRNNNNGFRLVRVVAHLIDH